uniref:Uncharacterized protein n=1 Tax=Manihot esculenta TaxID=3983 RepID=A0A2C9WGZ5_MANES
MMVSVALVDALRLRGCYRSKNIVALLRGCHSHSIILPLLFLVGLRNLFKSIVSSMPLLFQLLWLLRLS